MNTATARLPRWIRSATVGTALVADTAGVVAGAVLLEAVHQPLSRWAVVVAAAGWGGTLQAAAGAVALVSATTEAEVR